MKIQLKPYMPTDELLVCFYECPDDCGFERIPHLKVDDEYVAEYGDPDTMNARYCPGCGISLDWVDAK